MIISKPCHHISSVPFFLAYVDSFSPPAYIRMPGFHNVGRIDIHIGINICCIDPLPCIIQKKISSNCKNTNQILHAVDVISYIYGNTGCGVFKREVQNLKDFCLKINILKGNY